MDYTKTNLEFEKWLVDYVTKNDVSFSLIIIDKGQIIYKKQFGYQDRENKILIDDNTKFRFYSMTKPLTAIAVMTLYEKGLFDIYKPISEVLPICKNINKNITIYNLLTHSSGLIDIGSAEALKSTAKLDYNSQIENLAKEALLFEPGTKCLYTNSNFFILSLLVEYYSGETLENYLLKKVCAPLGMNTVEIETNHKIIDNLAVGYEMVDGKIVPGGFVNMDLMFGAGYSVGKIDDVYKLSLAVRERKLLKRETWDMILTPCSVGEYGLGCNVYKYNESPCCHHSGGYTGFRNLHRYFFEKDFAIGFLSNCGFGSARADVSKEIYERYFNLVDNMTYVEMDKGFV